MMDQSFNYNKKVVIDGVVDTAAGAGASCGVTDAARATAAATQRKEKRKSVAERQQAMEEARTAALQSMVKQLKSNMEEREANNRWMQGVATSLGFNTFVNDSLEEARARARQAE
ncbi:hypothetical protein RI054_28g115700 [Pseudoscourfieldia marina]